MTDYTKQQEYVDQIKKTKTLDKFMFADLIQIRYYHYCAQHKCTSEDGNHCEKCPILKEINQLKKDEL